MFCDNKVLEPNFGSIQKRSFSKTITSFSRTSSSLLGSDKESSFHSISVTQCHVESILMKIFNGYIQISNIENDAQFIVKKSQELRIRATLSPDLQIMAKLHHLLYYGEIIRKYGPPYLYRTFRYEATQFDKFEITKEIQPPNNIIQTAINEISKKTMISLNENETDYYNIGSFDAALLDDFFFDDRLKHSNGSYQRGSRFIVLEYADDSAGDESGFVSFDVFDFVANLRFFDDDFRFFLFFFAFLTFVFDNVFEIESSFIPGFFDLDGREFSFELSNLFNS
ncbi:hypothetical protein BLOT_008149 [Blomia tropicalis]|nr:hypothetical protein BLOT_008149 [Blomia tropicalis]